MSASPQRARAHRPPRRRRGLRTAALLAVGALLFVVGLALGRALEETPRPGGAETRVRTLQPLPLPPARDTVTVTVTQP